MTNKLKFIMLIDDDEPTNYLSKLIIKEADCCENVESYLDAEEALSFLQTHHQSDELPDLILLDINMPRMNGWEFLEEYKNIPFVEGQMPIIYMITTSVNPDDELRANQIDILSGFYLKPLSLEKLKVIQEAVHLARLVVK